MNEFVNILICLINAGMMVYTFALFFDSFSMPRWKWTMRLVALIGISIIFTAVLVFTPLGLIRTFLCVLLTLLVSMVYRLKWYNHLLLSFMAFAFIGMSELVTTVLLSAIFNIDTQAATQGVFQVVGIVLSKLLLIFLIVLFRFRKYKSVYAIPLRKSIVLLLLPTTTIIIVFIHVYWFLQIPFNSPLLAFSNIVSYVILIISNIIIFHIIDNTYKNEEKEKQIATAQELIRAQAEQYNQLQEHNKTVLKIRHDQKNFMIGLISELKNNNVEIALDALQKELNLLTNQSERNHGNNVISAVINAKSQIAQKDNIKINLAYNEIGKVIISSIDVAIILGNALDNAIESTRKIEADIKMIDVMIKVNNDLIVIAIKNPVSNAVDTNNLISTKRDNGTYGFGIASMKEIATKYGGDVLLSCEHSQFNTRIVLRNKIDK